MSQLETVSSNMIKAIKDYRANWRGDIPIKTIMLNHKLPLKFQKDGPVHKLSVYAKPDPGNEDFIWVHAMHHVDIGVISVSKEVWDELLQIPQMTKEQIGFTVLLHF